MLYGATPARGKAYNGLIMKRILTNSLALLTRPERRRMGMLVVLDTVISLADIASLAWLLFIVHLYTGQGAAGHLAFLPDWLQNNHSLLPIALFLLLFSGKNLAGFLVYRAQCRFISGVATRIAHKRLLHYLEGAYTNYVNVDSSVHIRNISYQPIDFGQHVLGGIQQIITQCILIVLAIAGILLFNVQLFLLVVRTAAATRGIDLLPGEKETEAGASGSTHQQREGAAIPAGGIERFCGKQYLPQERGLPGTVYGPATGVQPALYRSAHYAGHPFQADGSIRTARPLHPGGFEPMER
jgi:hypothetical protein